MNREELIERARSAHPLWTLSDAEWAADFAAALLAEERERTLAWAIERKRAETENRPDDNIYKRTLVQTWDQIIRHLRRAPEKLEPVAASHPEIEAQSPGPSNRREAGSGVQADKGGTTGSSGAMAGADVPVRFRPPTDLPPAPSSAQRQRAEELLAPALSNYIDSGSYGGLIDAMLAYGAEERRAAFAEAAQMAYEQASHAHEHQAYSALNALGNTLSAASRPGQDENANTLKGPSTPSVCRTLEPRDASFDPDRQVDKSAVGRGQDARGAESVSAPLSPAAPSDADVPQPTVVPLITASDADVLERAAEILSSGGDGIMARTLKHEASKLRARPSEPGDWETLARSIAKEWYRDTVAVNRFPHPEDALTALIVARLRAGAKGTQ